MATFNDLKTIIANIDEALGEGHIIKYFPERYSSTPTKTFTGTTAKTDALAYGTQMLTKYKTVQEALVKSAGDIKTKVEALIKKNNWSNLTVVDLSPNPCNISFSEVIYGIAGAKSTKNVINTTTEVTNTNTQAKTTTSTLKSTDWESSTFYDLTNDKTEAATVTLGASNITTDSSAGTSTDTHDDTTATVTHYRHPLVITNRLLDGLVYDTVLVLLYYFYKNVSAGCNSYTYVQITPVVSGTTTDGVPGSFSNMGRRMCTQTTDNYNLNEDTHKLSGLGTSGATSWAGSTENTDVTLGYNYWYSHMWWKDKDTGKVTYYGAKDEVDEWRYSTTNTSATCSVYTTKTTTITGGTNGTAIDHNLEFLEIDNSYSKIKEAQTPRNADINTTVAMKTRYTKNTKPSWVGTLTDAASTKSNTDANGNEQTATVATANISSLTTTEDKDVIVTTNYKTGATPDTFSLGSWAYGTYNSSTGLGLSASDYSGYSSFDSHLSNLITSWLNYYNLFTRAAMFKQADHAILFLHDNVLPNIPKKFIDLNALSCANYSNNNGTIKEAYDGTEYTTDNRKVKLAGQMLKDFKYTVVPNLVKSTTAKATVTSFPISSQFADVTNSSTTKSYIQLYYTVTAIRRAWKYYTGMTLTDNQIKRIENETPTAAQSNIYTVNGTVLSLIPLGWYDDWGEYDQDMHDVQSTDASNTAKYLPTSDYRFNANGNFGKLDLLYQDERVDGWASGTDIYAAGTTLLAAGTAANLYHTRALIVIVIAPTYISYRLVGPSTAISNCENLSYCYSTLTITKAQDMTDTNAAVTSAYLNAKGAWDYLKSIDTDGSLLKWCKTNNCELITEPYGATLVVNDLYNRKNDTSIDLWAQYTLIYNKDLMCFKSDLLHGDIAVTTNDY